MDPEARSYFQLVEEHYQKTVGRPLILSPKDVEAVREWWEQGVPVDCALRGITLYIDRIRQDPRKRSRRLAVRYAANDVFECADELRTSRIGDRRGDRAEDTDRVKEVLLSLAERVGTSDTVPLTAAIAASLRRLREDFEAGDRDAGVVEEQLEALDRELVAAVRDALGAEALDELRRDAEARLSDVRARMEPDAWEKTVALLEERLLRERTGIPRLSLYAY